MEAGLLSKLPNKTLVMSNKNQFPFSFTCLASKLFLLWMTSRRSGPLHNVWVFLSSSGAVKSSCSQEECAYSWAAAYSMHWWWCVVRCVVAQAERERLLRQSNCSLQPLLPILTQPACIKTPAVHCAGESPRFSLDSLCGISWFQSTHMLVGQSIESNALQKISTDKALLCRVGKDLGYIWHSFLRSMPYIVQS